MTEQLFRRYADLKRQIALLDDELKTLQPKIMGELKPLRDARLRTSFGIFSVLRHANWNYSEVVEQLEEQLKARQMEEKANGAAKVEYKEYVQYKSSPVTAAFAGARAS
jgi:hypothetical protein